MLREVGKQLADLAILNGPVLLVLVVRQIMVQDKMDLLVLHTTE
jgi:hypothetical protein